METLDPNAYLTLQELYTEVNRLGRQHGLVAKSEPVTGRTVRFYIEKELLPPPGRSGPGKKYPRGTVWKVLFILRLRRQYRLALNQMRQALREVDVETMRRVVTGEEPLEIHNGADLEAVKRHQAQGHQVVALPADSGGDIGITVTNANGWRVLLESGDAVLTVREGLSPAKLKQLMHIAALTRAIVDQE